MIQFTVVISKITSSNLDFILRLIIKNGYKPEFVNEFTKDYMHSLEIYIYIDMSKTWDSLQLGSLNLHGGYPKNS